MAEAQWARILTSATWTVRTIARGTQPALWTAAVFFAITASGDFLAGCPRLPRDCLADFAECNRNLLNFRTNFQGDSVYLRFGEPLLYRFVSSPLVEITDNVSLLY